MSQATSLGISSAAIHAAAMAHAAPRPGLRWADIGCGTGDDLRLIRDQYAPSLLVGSDLLSWLPEDLADVQFIQADAVDALDLIPAVDRLLMVESIEHLEAPWTALRKAARKVAPGGVLVVTTPNIASLRHRLELPLRGGLTSFRTDNVAHLTPILSHVALRILAEEGLTPTVFYANPEVIPFTGGHRWPAWVSRRAPRLLSVSLGIAARRL